MNKEDDVRKHIQDNLETNRYLLTQINTIIAIADKITTAFKSNNKMLIFGNGGSAADAQHIAAELSGKFYIDRPSLPAIAITTNTSIITAIGNDFNYEDIFARQLHGLICKNDIVLGISTGGNSANIVKGIETAKELGAVTMVFTGSGGKLKDMADFVLAINSSITPRIQEAHITAGHIICYLVENSLFGNKE